MTALLRAELLKLRTTRAPTGWSLATLVLAGLGAAALIGGTEQVDRLEPGFLRDVLAIAGISNLVAVIFGVAVVTGEWRYETVASTFLAAPVRERVLAAKAIAASIAGGLFAAVALLVVALVSVPWLAAVDVPLELDTDRAAQAGGVLLAALLGGLLGTALGSLLHAQMPALVGTLMWFFVIEPIEASLLPRIDLERLVDVLPARALGVLDGSNDHIAWWRAVIVVLAWSAALALPGVRRTRRRDVT